MAWDIEEALNQVIFKYDMDGCYPKYRKMFVAEKIINSISNSWQSDDKILCIITDGSGNKGKIDREKFLNSVVIESVDKIHFVVCPECVDNESPYRYKRYDYKVLETIRWNEYNKVYVISNKGDNFVGVWLRQHDVKFQSIYDLFRSNGLDYDDDGEWHECLGNKNNFCFCAPYDDYLVDNIVAEFYDQKKRYEMYNDASVKRVVLEKIVFLSVLMRDFILVEKYINILVKLAPDKPKYILFGKELQGLLLNIKRCLQERNTHDIVAFWIDATSYYTLSAMPFVASIKDKSICFDNHISMNNFTHEVLKTMFLRKKLLEDNSDDIKCVNPSDSNLINMLEDEGYEIKIAYCEDYFPAEYRADGAIKQYVPGSMRLWKMWRELLKTDKPSFIMTGALENHGPHITAYMDDDTVLSGAKRKGVAVKALDRQIEFYVSFMGNKTSLIFFSDHGCEGWWPKPHIFMMIYGKRHRPQRIDGLTSNIDFDKVIRKILDGEDDFSDLTREYVELQGNNVRVRYNLEDLKRRGILPQATPSFYNIFQGYRGVATKEYVYFAFTGGREILFRRDHKYLPHWYTHEDDICNNSLLPYFREKAKVIEGWYSNMIETDQYKRLKSAYDSGWSRNMKKVEIINKWMEDNEAKHIALLGGGEPSCQLYYMLNKKNRNRIKYVIDDSEKCSCSSLGINVITVKDLKCVQISVVIILQHESIEILQKYVDSAETKVVDIYNIYKDCGLNIGGNFWDFQVGVEEFFLPERAVTRQSVTECYRFILGREPESESVINGFVKKFQDIFALRDEMLKSREFMDKFKSKSLKCIGKKIGKLNRKDVMNCYFYILGRIPSEIEVSNKLKTYRDFDLMWSHFFYSMEFDVKYKKLQAL